MVEDKDNIDINEFKAWLVGLIRGKNGSLPNYDDWVEIKKMLDKVKSEPIEQIKIVPVTVPQQPSPYKYWPPYTIGDPPYVGDNPGNLPTITWYSDTTVTPEMRLSYTVNAEYDADAAVRMLDEWVKD